ncbi:MAG TPA: aminopeptidase P family protein [Butyricimonas sp.]|uniref:aminopeptidase P family protein n=1 Tax=Butyricimonas TaxID=574697 RepID=UPI000EC8B903|nr:MULTISPECIES: aminopeptidase P family protein [Butyricimonas]HAM82819.1 aminopeptidase P family protein [Butyricimonas sp.]HCH88095.1 aminopeptidase P family protein [Butyricimonas sp.]
MNIPEKLIELRRIMDRENIAAYIISGTDPHNSEYLPAPWQQRKWISGFTGSFGTVVVTKDEAGLWTDTRYFIQAEKELAGSGIKLHKLRIPGAVDYPQWLAEVLESGDKVGIDGFCMSVSDVRNLKNTLSPKNITIQEQIDLLGEMWFDRPALPMEKIIRLEAKYVGESAGERIGKIREFICDNHGDAMLFSCLDEIAWLYNIRCNDIAYNPVAISYAIVEKDKAHLFIKLDKISQEIARQLATDGIELHDYHHLFLFLDEQKKENVYLVDTNTCNYAVFNHLSKKFEVREVESPIPLLKAVKNPTELEGFRLACRKDGVALSKFYYWLENKLSQQPVTELEAAEQLTRLRSQDKEYVSDSFGCISAYGPNAALPHYSATPEQQSEIHPKGLYLVDSGAQYTHGTTDITRTMPLGELTELEKEDYTLVLKGMIDLSMLYFPKGSKGCNIDIVARLPLYMKLRNFGHGTGHGVGYFLNVHEGPQSIRPDLKNQEILPGMVTSNEPGLYREGLHGIRHENLIVCQPKSVNEFGEFYQFETITLCYLDTSALLTKLLNQNEIDWLNAYNERVYQEVSPYLEEQERIWLRNKTKAI